MIDLVFLPRCLAGVLGLAALLLVAAGCTTAGPDDDDDAPDPGSDEDGDGLTLEEEEDLGTDPETADTDGDGWEDGEEHDGEYDPLDAGDHPYTGGYGRDDCHADFLPAAYSPGETAADFTLTDQFDEQVHLRDFCGRVVYLEVGARW